MISVKRTRVGVVSLARILARASGAGCLVLSFFFSLAPLATFSAAADSTMACCAGQVGHCKSGLHAKRRTQPAPEPLCGLRKLSGNRENDLTEQSGEVADERITIIAAAPETQAAQETSNNDSVQRTSRTRNTPALHHALTEPCPIDCRAGTAAVRHPRPRETLSLINRHPTVGLLLSNFTVDRSTNSYASSSLRRVFPRGPPSASC
jgi:hypothetical protein